MAASFPRGKGEIKKQMCVRAHSRRRPRVLFTGEGDLGETNFRETNIKKGKKKVVVGWNFSGRHINLQDFKNHLC